MKYQLLNISVIPKAHYIFEHLLYLVDKHEGSIEAYAEDFIEQSHQTGVQEKSKSSSIASKTKKAYLHQKWEYERGCKCE